MHSDFEIEKRNGRITETSREIFKEQFDLLGDGKWKIRFDPAKDGYTATRYRYYFGCILSAILSQAGHLLQITNMTTGDRRRMRNTTELHTYMKWKYNLVWIMVGETAMPSAGTTTELNDREFIANFMEQIISDHAGPPYNVDFVEEDEWKAMLKSGEWYGRKEMAQR